MDDVSQHSLSFSCIFRDSVTLYHLQTSDYNFTILFTTLIEDGEGYNDYTSTKGLDIERYY